MMASMNTENKCRKCGGSGYIPSLARVDGGRCWSCNNERVPTAEQVADDEAYREEMGLTLTLEERQARRRARKAAR